MLAGAFARAAATWRPSIANPLVGGLMAAIVVSTAILGACVPQAFAFSPSILYRGNQMRLGAWRSISSLPAAPRYILRSKAWFAQKAAGTPSLSNDQRFSAITLPFCDETERNRSGHWPDLIRVVLSAISILVYIAFSDGLRLPVVGSLFRNPVRALRLRAVGENPRSCRHGPAFRSPGFGIAR